MNEIDAAIAADSDTSGLAERILVLAPTFDDAELVAKILLDRNLEVEVVADLEALTREIERGVGVVLIASEALDDRRVALQEALERQEAWSEVPILLFGGGVEDEASQSTKWFGSRAQVVFLERPLGIASFVTATEAALRSRRRQYELKDLLDDLAESAVEVARAHDEANRAKDDFIATLAHELRSPMTAILGWIQMLKMHDLAPEDAATALSMIESSTRVQAHVVEDLMDVSRIVAGKVMIEPAAVELPPIVEAIVATFRSGAEMQGIELTADIPSESLVVWADDARLQQVGWNLVSNAIKFTPKGGSVHVSLAREDDRAVIRVRDTGQGLSRELLPHIFDRYRQGEIGMKKSHGGLGLGLAIVRHLVQSQNGLIEAFSDGVDKGAEFVVSLPLLVPESTGGPSPTE